MTPFAKKVYKVVAGIPLGQVRSYKWVASKCGRPKACRAVGSILKNNPYPLIIPCHRVIKSSNDPGEYILGKGLKRKLLAIESRMKKCIGDRG